MARAIGRRLAALASVLLAVSILTFGATAFLGGCVECQVAGVAGLEDDRRAEIRADLRLDDPLPERYGAWLGGAVTGDLGQSYRTRQDVRAAVAERLPVTLQLVALSMTVSLVVSIPLGVLSAHRAGGALDRLVAGASFGLLATPGFLLAIFLIHLFAVEWDLLPATGWTRLTEDPLDSLRTTLLPAVALASTNIAMFTRMLRSDMVATLQEEHVLVARSKGLPTWYILFRHSLRPSAFSLLTVSGLAIGGLLGGAVIIERLFALPGLGQLLVQSVEARDLIMVQGLVLVMTAGFVLVNSVVDVLYHMLDPRIRRRGGDHG